jgi:hypothetical protein
VGLHRSWPLGASEVCGELRILASRQISHFSLQPIPNNPCSLLAVAWPPFWEAIVCDLVALNAKRILNNLGGAVAVVSADCLFEKVGYAWTPRRVKSPGGSHSTFNRCPLRPSASLDVTTSHHAIAEYSETFGRAER